MSFSKTQLLLVLLSLTAVLAFWKLGETPLMQWDESRNGVSALEMTQSGDWLNAYYGGKPDDWSIKPPLAIWMINWSFQLLGPSALSLRLPTALLATASMFVFFSIVRLYRSATFAFLAGLILLSATGFLGPHVGRSGDYEMPLLFFLWAGLYYFLRAVDFQYARGMIWAGFCWALAFWVKGPGAFVLFPGLVLFVFWRKKWKWIWQQASTWWGILLFGILTGLWVLAIFLWGTSFETANYPGQNAVERIFLNDILNRFTNPDYESAQAQTDLLFFFTYLDARFNLWNYLFYGSLILLFKAYFFPRQKALTSDSLLSLSICLWASLAVLFTLATSKNHWYMAPVLPFLVLTTLEGLKLHWSYFKYLTIGLLLFTLTRQVYRFSQPAPLPPLALQAQELLQDQHSLAILPPLPRQHELLYLHFASSATYYPQNIPDLQKMPPEAWLFLTEKTYRAHQKQLAEYPLVYPAGEYVFLRKN